MKKKRSGTLPPVSYTHLDVYKRQLLSQDIQRNANNKESEGGNVYCTRAVSYTHLDVYKRQVISLTESFHLK